MMTDRNEVWKKELLGLNEEQKLASLMESISAYLKSATCEYD